VVGKAKAHEARLKRASWEVSEPSKSWRSPTSSDLAEVPVGEVEPQPEDLLEVVRQQDHSISTLLPSTFTLVPTTEEMAIGFFFSNYVIGVQGPTRGHLAILYDIYNTYDMDENLFTSMKAVGLAGYSLVAHAPKLMKDARQQYTKALWLTNKALTSLIDAKKDSTLLAVMILGIFETITGCNQRSLKAWTEHINGSAALVGLRGMEQLKTPAGRRMFIQATSNILTSCIQRQLPVPTHILELRAEAAKYIFELGPEAAKHFQTVQLGWFVHENMIALANFCSQTRSGAVSDPQVILSRALEIDGALLGVFSDIPPCWEYEIMFTDTNNDIVYNGCYHVYYDYGVAQLWNAMRTIRILLNEQIRKAILAGLGSKPPRFLGPEYTAQLQISTDIILQMQADILASVPQHLGYVSSPSEVLSEPPLIRSVSGFFLMWPLFLCGVIDMASKPIQRWVIQTLQYIGRTMGIQQAFVVAEVVERQEEIKAWY
jgi:hypothetical protein